MADSDEHMKDTVEDEIDEEILNASTADIVTRRHLLANDIKIMKSESQRLTHEKSVLEEKIRDNREKIENSKYV